MKFAMRLNLLACILLLGACTGQPTQPAASAAQPAAAAQPAVASTAPASDGLDPDRVVCKQLAPTGTRISKRTCYKASEWEKMARDAKEATDKVQLLGLQKGVKSG